MEKYKLIIAGGRDFHDYNLLEEKAKEFINDYAQDRQIIIVSGHAKGADTLGEYFARKYDYDLLLYPAEWNRYGNSAGPIRNADMARVADGCLAFWDGESKGTANMIMAANKMGLAVKTVLYKPSSTNIQKIKT